MSEHPLYREIRKQIWDQVDNGVPAASRERLTLLVLGIIKGKSVSPSKIAQALDELGICGGKVESIERQIRRMHHDPHLTTIHCFHPLVRHYLRIGKQKQLVLVLDPTLQEDRMVMATVSMVYQGRSLPLAWVIWPANQPLKGKGFWERIQELVDEIKSLLPQDAHVIWLADRAFGTPIFTDMVTQHGWHYIVRVQGHTCYRDQVGRIRPISSLVNKPGTRCKLYGQAFKAQKWRAVSVLAFWGKGHKKPLLLVTDLPPQWQLVALYKKRYHLEATFRDFKTVGWHLEDCLVRDFDHLQRLLLGMALATWFTLMAGTQVALELLQSSPSTHRRTRPFDAKFSLFSLGLHRLHQWLCRNCRHPLAWHLVDWDIPSWQRRLTAHHVHAFIFATSARYYG